MKVSHVLISGLAVLGVASCTNQATPEYKATSVTTDNASCHLSESICVPTHTFREVTFNPDEVLLTYDSATTDDVADAVLKKYKIRAKRTDELTSIKTKLVTAATNGQDPITVIEAIKQKEKNINAGTNNYFKTAIINAGSESKAAYPLGLTGISSLRDRTSGKGVLIGMIDTPIDITHDSLRSSIERVELVAAGDEKNRLHGTQVAGVMISRNPRIGVAPDANLLAISTFSVNPNNPAERRSDSALVARALQIAIDRNVDVLNLSFAGAADPLVDKLIQAAVQKGIVVVASAGNGGPGASPAYPAALPGVIAVTAVDKGEGVFRQANRGSYIDLAAPGVGILTTAPRGAFDVSSGTSLATAHATGVIALLMSVNKNNFRPELLNNTAIDLGQPGRDDDYGYGLISAERAVKSIAP